MSRIEYQQLGYILAELEALKEFSPPPPEHLLKLDRSILELKRLTENYAKHGKSRK